MYSDSSSFVPYLVYGTLGLVLALAPFFASAHEVYVLSPETIAHDIATPSPSPLLAFVDNRTQFFIWGFIAFVLVSTVFFASITHRLEFFFEPMLTRLRPWAPLVARLTLGACLIASAHNMALFGPELPLSDFGPWALVAQWALYISGALILVNVLTLPAAVVAMVVFAGGAALYGWYMLNYANYLGEMLVVFLLAGFGFGNLRSKKISGGGGQREHFGVKRFFLSGNSRLEPIAFLILRVAFGISVAFASIYAKFIHSNLALSTISEYHLTNFFHFDPLFIVLGACIIEVLMGIFFIIGFEIRHTALFFLFWIFLSLLYFGESVWPHLVLAGVNVALFMYGYDKYTIEGRLFNRGKLQPFL